jgi:hypothetical protein
MTPVLSVSSLAPTVADVTLNGEATGNVVGSLELLSLPGIVISFINDDSFTCSSDSAVPATELYAGETDSMTTTANVSVGSTNSSTLGIGTAGNDHVWGHGADMERCLLDEAACLNLAAVLLVLGSVVALLLEAAGEEEQFEEP